MKLLFIALSIAVVTLCVVRSGGAQTQSPSKKGRGPKRESAFACDRAALTPEARKRHFDELGPALGAKRKSIRELKDGFEFEFPFDAATFHLVTEWAAGEHLCCPFFDIDVRLEREGGALWLRLTGREGVKQFVKADFAAGFKVSDRLLVIAN